VEALKMARVLFVTSRLPYPPLEGHQLRAWHLLRAAASVHQVSLLSLQRPDDPVLPAAELTDLLVGLHRVALPSLKRPGSLLALGLRRMLSRRPLLDLRYRASALQWQFDRLVGQADLVHLDILAIAGLLERVPDSTPVVLNEHNVESLLARKRMEIESSPLRRLMLWAASLGLARFEIGMCSQASLVLSCSPEDADRLRTLAPESRVGVVPNGVDLEFFRPGQPQEQLPDSLVFVGHMNWFPNRDGIEYLVNDILPLLDDRPALSLKVIGRNESLAIPTAMGRRVEFTGFVDDLRPLVQQAAVFVVPLRAGSGTRLKILEAMAMGKAIVSTRIGAEGIGLVDGQTALLADTPEDFATAVRRLLDDPELRSSLGWQARALAEKHYGWNAIGQRLLASYDALLEPGVQKHRSDQRLIDSPASRFRPAASRPPRAAESADPACPARSLSDFHD
jgi:polysaccharide biosynthesis protein PslH